MEWTRFLCRGSFPMKSFLQDPMQIVAFRAIQCGIFVTCSAGNVGPFNGSVSGPSPWVLTVGASAIDRRFRATAGIGNRREDNGESLFQPTNFKNKLIPLLYPANDTTSPAFWDPQTLQRFDLKGKIVLSQGGLVEPPEFLMQGMSCGSVLLFCIVVSFISILSLCLLS
ncbi:Peptidase S8, subtilisin-related [Parasponia andersonii]|uniref:Peptidase S8, subtilisin-related n=1 Tax=Parasponia andersonii TaxID=3476 RepID=A0A2P5C8Z2_PARAD|nr:Peptidase S8, subtilisin-related [Parasponia andersonii]